MSSRVCGLKRGRQTGRPPHSHPPRNSGNLSVCEEASRLTWGSKRKQRKNAKAAGVWEVREDRRSVCDGTCCGRVGQPSQSPSNGAQRALSRDHSLGDLGWPVNFTLSSCINQNACVQFRQRPNISHYYSEARKCYFGTLRETV